uniref:Uncharacterized protein n=1 Tax=Palpitomonas bilix TaxID=652834 RepID=A0A7S3DDP6_9EUKA
MVDPDGNSNDELGRGGTSLSATGLVLAVASDSDDDKGDGSGTVSVWQRANNSISFADVIPTKLVDPDGNAFDSLGRSGPSLSANGLVLAAASFRDDNQGNESGSVLVWESICESGYTPPLCTG